MFAFASFAEEWEIAQRVCFVASCISSVCGLRVFVRIVCPGMGDGQSARLPSMSQAL